MSFITPNLNLPYIAPSQAQKHVTHNEAIRALDALVQLSLQSKGLSTPPASPIDGERYFVASSPTGAWTGMESQIAAFQDGAWAFFSPQSGWRAWIDDESTFQIWDGQTWQVVGGESDFQNLDHVGINSTADNVNRLSLASEASLFSHDGAGHQLKVNKNTSSDTGSLLYQTNYSGRAEMGLAGNDDFKIKVSANGSAWKDALSVNSATGEINMPFTPPRARFIISNGYRFYCYTNNRWVTSSDDLYGTSYYQASESGGTGTDPAIKWQQQGLFLAAGTKIHDIHVIGRASSTSLTDLECYGLIQRPNQTSEWGTGVNVNAQINTTDVIRDFWYAPAVGTVFAGVTTSLHKRTFSAEHELSADGFFTMFVKPVGTATANRYFYGTIAIECSLPS